MITLIIGTNNSGKSELAEKLAVQRGTGRKYYLATMQLCDDASRARAEKHRRMRAGKGFLTIEKECRIREVLSSIEDAEEALVLLECVSNLVGNELHSDPKWLRSFGSGEAPEDTFTEMIVSDIKAVADRVRELILVTNEYDKDDAGYDRQTRIYVELLSRVNERLRDAADEVIDLRKD